MQRDLENMSNEITKVLSSSAKKEKINKAEYEQALAQVKSTKTEELKTKLNSNTKVEESSKKGTLDLKLWQTNMNLVEKAESEYKIAVLNHQYTDKIFMEFMKEELDRLEKLDRKRIELTKRVLIDYKDLNVEISKLHKERLKAMQKAFSEIDVKKDIRDFILSVKTGNTREAPMVFEPYIIKVPDN